MSKIIPKYKAGDMFSMEPDSRLIITSVDNILPSYRIAHAIQDRVTNTSETEMWTAEKLHDLVNRGKIKFVCNIFSIVVLPFTFIRACSPEPSKV